MSEDEGIRASQRPTVVPLPPADDGSAPSVLPVPGDSVGGHRVVRLRGAGGQGVVFDAEEKGTGRLVALKMLLPNAGAEDIRRFEREIEVLASLEHRHVAALLDTGVHQGRPWFTMRLVEGPSITQHAERAALGHEDAVRLLLRACDAVAHAHARGVIHRDLKPDNVRIDAAGEPVVLDFGLARHASSATLTHSSAPLGTLTHAAPEMLAGDVRRVDVRADVYSLGVMLYTILAGRLPLDVPENLSAAIDVVRHREPSPPSAHRPGLDRDLDAICLRCLAKDPSERYASVLDLQRDLEAWLSGAPVEARSRAPGYALRKTLWRHRGLVAATAAVMSALALLAIAIALYARKLERERDRARDQEARATALATAFTSLLEDADPESASADLAGADPCERGSAAHLIAHVGRRIQHDLDAEPRVLASIQGAAGNAFVAIGVPDRAVPMHQGALLQLESLPDATRDEIDAAELALAMSRTANRSTPEERAHLADLVHRLRLRRVEAPGLFARALHHQAVLLRREGSLEAALDQAREAHAIRAAHQGPHRDTISSAMLEGALLVDAGRPGEALEVLGRASDSAEAALWRGHPAFTRIALERARALEALGRLSEAVTEAEVAIFSLERSHGAGHPLVAAAATEAARIFSRAGHHAEAERRLRDVLELQRLMHGPHHPATHATLVALAAEVASLGRPSEAECLRAEALIVERRLDLAVP